MKKKVNVFGKSVPVLLLVLLGMGLVSAALIPYWGTITGFITINAPMEQKIEKGLIDTASSIDKDSVSSDLLGGGEVLLSIKTQNLATDKSIFGVAENLVIGSGTALDLAANCGEFSKLLMKTVSTGGGTSWPNPTSCHDESSCVSVGNSYGLTFVWEGEKCWDDALANGYCSSNDTTMTIAYGSTPYNTWAAGQVDITQIKAEFMVNAIGTYDFTSQIIPYIL